MDRTLHRVGSVGLAVALALTLTVVGLSGSVAAQSHDSDDTTDDLEDSMEKLNTTAEEKQERHNLTQTAEQLDTTNNDQTLKATIALLETDR